VRTIAEVGGYAYGRSRRGVWVHLYGANVLDTELPEGGRFKLTQETNYPWDGRVRITVNAAPTDARSVLLRIPGWARGATVSVNGAAAAGPVEPGTYFEIRSKWSTGDVIELNLPLTTRLLQAHPLVEELRNQVAVQRGPVVYCLESADLPKGTRVQDVLVPRGIRLTPRFDATLLAGVTVLEGKAEMVRSGDWSGQLYRELPQTEPVPVELKLTPYYAWGNRGPSEMTVWLPLAR
jgi:DUF1680 family protein